MRSVSRGFTLIELMITVAIVAILATVAYPSYTQYVMKSRRADGRALLLQAASKMQRYGNENNGSVADATLTKLQLSETSERGYYQLSIVSKGADGTYKVQVEPQGAQASDACGTLSIDDAGTRTPNDDKCW